MRRIAEIPAGDRPLPLDGLLAKPPTHGVFMNVVDSRQDHFRSPKISIVTRAFLSESKRLVTGPIADDEFREQLGVVLFEDSVNLP